MPRRSLGCFSPASRSAAAAAAPLGTLSHTALLTELKVSVGAAAALAPLPPRPLPPALPLPAYTPQAPDAILVHC